MAFSMKILKLFHEIISWMKAKRWWPSHFKWSRCVYGVEEENGLLFLFFYFCCCFEGLKKLLKWYSKWDELQVLNNLQFMVLDYSLLRAFSRNKSKSPFPGWRHRLLRHCSRCTARRHISPIRLYLLSRLRA